MEESAVSVSLENNDEVEIDLFDLLRFLLLRCKYIILAAIAGALLFGFYAYVLATPIYEATAQLYVVNSKDSAVDLSDLQIGTYLTSDYGLVFDTWEVNQQVKNNLGLDYSVEQLRKMISVTNPSNTRALFITVSSTDPHEAMIMANEYSEVAKQYIYDTMLSDMPSTLSVALEPTKPVSPRRFMLLCLGAFLGCVACVALLFILYLRDDKIKTPQDLQRYSGVAPLAVIPYTNLSQAHRRRNSHYSETRS